MYQGANMHDEKKFSKVWGSAYEHYNILLKQRLATFTLFFVVFSSMCIGAYYAHTICNSPTEKFLVLLGLALLITFVVIIFYFLLKKENYYILNNRIILMKLEKKMGLNDELKLYSKEQKYSCCSNTKCFNWVLFISWISYIFLLISIWYPPQLNCPTSNGITQKNINK